MMQDFVSWISE